MESLKYRAAALMKRDNSEITSDMTDAETIGVMDKYLDMAEKKLAEVLDIAPEALDVPDIDSCIGLYPSIFRLLP